jgi:myo-inositol-1(or 4)-monophosphatase
MRLETECAIRAVRIAQEIADSRRGSDRVSSKGGIDLVTDTDIACEDAIRAELLRSFPSYAVIGEERGGTPQDGHPYWLVDPICGTRNFASSIPLYCTNISLVEQGEVRLGVVGFGITKEIVYAEHNSGARLLNAQTEVRIQTGDSSHTIWLDGKTEQGAEVVKRALTSGRWYVVQFPSGLAYAYAACARLAAALQFSGSALSKPPSRKYGSVHSAAGCFIAREAGAIVRDIHDGTDWKLSTSGFVIAGSERLYEELLSLF